MTEFLKNNDYTLKIIGMNHEGQGVGRINNFTVFVDGAIIGETVDIKLIKVNKSYGIGKLLNILEPSKDRIESFCDSYKRCGGCTLQHMTYEAQLKYKTNIVKDALQRIGKIDSIQVNQTIGMESPFNYRNKAQFPVREINGKVSMGFYAKHSHNVIECENCKIQDNIINKVKQVVEKYIKKFNVSVYNEDTMKGIIRHVLIRNGLKTGEVMVVIIINSNKLYKSEELVKMLKENIQGLASIILNINKKNTNVILGEKNITIFGKDRIEDYIGGLKFEISPKSFYQVNPRQTEILYSTAIQYAGLTGKETVFDLYCGIGTITLSMAKKAKFVYGVEIVEDAIKDAKRNAEINGINNVEFVVGKAENIISRMYQDGIKADVVIVDPPRKGCDEVLLNTLVEMEPERIVYVSCNPATLARDVLYLTQHGFCAEIAQPVDMFAWSYHVECVVLMSRVQK